MVFSQSLLERIDGLTSATSTTLDVSKLRASVIAHLRDLLNTRQGSSPAVEDYGLPDFADILLQFGDDTQAREELKRQLIKVIERYERRLKNVRVEFLASEGERSGRSVIQFKITARLVDVALNQAQVLISTQLEDGRVWRLV